MKAPHEQAEFRGGPLATARLLLDCYVRPDRVWDSIEPSEPDDEPPSIPDAIDDACGGQAA